MTTDSARIGDDPPTSYLIVSPHIDDATLSLGGSMRVWIDEGASVRVINVFSRSGFRPDAATVRDGFRNLDEVSAMRKAEELDVAADIGHSVEFLDLLDGALRGRRGSMYALARYGTLPRTGRHTRSHILAQLRARLDADQPALFPLGAGTWRHPDHVLISSIGRELALEGFRTEFYEDLPYAASDPSLLDLVPADLVTAPATLNIDLDDKLRVLGHYGSQMHADMLDPVSAHARALGGTTAIERRWRVIGRTSSSS